MTVNKLIKELQKLQDKGLGRKQVVYLGGEYRGDYHGIDHLHTSKGDFGISENTIVINGSDDD